MSPSRPTAAQALLVLAGMLVFAACGDTAPSPSPSAASTPETGLSAIACATDDSTDVGDLTGVWQADPIGVYYIRQVGDCVWWFGTELDDIEPGVAGQPGFANVAAGRIDGTTIRLEYADVPMGDILHGGGITLVYDAQADQLTVIDRRGTGIPFGNEVLTRIGTDASPAESPSSSPSP